MLSFSPSPYSNRHEKSDKFLIIHSELSKKVTFSVVLFFLFVCAKLHIKFVSKRVDFFLMVSVTLNLFSKVPRNKNNTQIYSLETISKNGIIV